MVFKITLTVMKDKTQNLPAKMLPAFFLQGTTENVPFTVTRTQPLHFVN